MTDEYYKKPTDPKDVIFAFPSNMQVAFEHSVDHWNDPESGMVIWRVRTKPYIIMDTFTKEKVDNGN